MSHGIKEVLAQLAINELDCKTLRGSQYWSASLQLKQPIFVHRLPKSFLCKTNCSRIYTTNRSYHFTATVRTYHIAPQFISKLPWSTPNLWYVEKPLLLNLHIQQWISDIETVNWIWTQLWFLFLLEFGPNVLFTKSSHFQPPSTLWWCIFSAFFVIPWAVTNFCDNYEYVIQAILSISFVTEVIYAYHTHFLRQLSFTR